MGAGSRHKLPLTKRQPHPKAGVGNWDAFAIRHNYVTAILIPQKDVHCYGETRKNNNVYRRQDRIFCKMTLLPLEFGVRFSTDTNGPR
jgi:hypothetical protein